MNSISYAVNTDYSSVVSCSGSSRCCLYQKAGDSHDVLVLALTLEELSMFVGLEGIQDRNEDLGRLKKTFLNNKCKRCYHVLQFQKLKMN
ncbi:hypothetical protein GQ457_08G028150 [Hibiscus cannabinus]